MKEARESNYWLRLILATGKFESKIKQGIEALIEESSEIAKIVAAIIISTKNKS